MAAPVLVVMGVSGSGKSTVGAELARRLGVPFADADDFHPPANIEKMAAGVPLDDHDREPWLEAGGAWLAAHPDGAVMGCSALKRRYRDILRHQVPQTAFLHLTGTRDTIAARQANRPGHFMPSSLLSSQFHDLEPLEPDERGLSLDVADGVETVVAAYLAQAQEGSAPGSSDGRE